MMNKKPISGKPSISDLPLPILSDILSLLPTKSILSCKIVCKLWCSIIRDPQFSKSSKFITMIARRNGDNRANKNLHLVEPEVDYAVRKRFGDLCFMIGKNAVIKFNDGGFDGIPVKKLGIVHSCKGLACLTSRCHHSLKERKITSDDWALDPFIVCNPVTYDYVVVKQPFSEEMAHSCVQRDAGFGFSSKTNQYKVLRFIYNWKKKDDDVCFLMADVVCTLGSDEEWRHLENRPPDGSLSGKGTFFEGALHWIILHEKTFGGNIVAFDCEEEKFGLVDPPSVLNESLMETRHPSMDLAILHSRLCFCL